MADDKQTPPQFSFAILTDLHLDELEGRDKFSHTLESLKNEKDLDFLLILGDLGCQGSLAEFKQQLTTVNLPYHIVPGNHDAKRLREFQEAFGPLYYTFEFGACLFVGLFNATPAVEMMQAHHGQLDAQQEEWLHQVLEEASAQEQQYRKIFLFAHIPPLQPGSPMYPPFRMDVDTTDLIYALCHEHQVDAAFYGHVHLHEAFDYQGTWHITTPSVNWNFNTCYGYDHKDWMAVDYGGYRIVHVFENEISDELRWTHRNTDPIQL